MAATDSKRSIGTGALRSASGSSLPSLRSASSPDGPPSPAEPYGFGEGPYGGGGSRAMHDMTKLALGTASVGRKMPTKPKDLADTFDWPSSTPGRPWMRRGDTEITPPKRWLVDDRGWSVGAKADSSPKVLKTVEPVSVMRPTVGMRSATTNNMPKRIDWDRPPAMTFGPRAMPPANDRPTIARGRVLGGRKEHLERATKAGAQHFEGDHSPSRGFPIRNPTAAQVDAYKHYEEKARRSSYREYKPGFAPRRLSSQEEKVADAGWEARKTRQLSKIERLCDELYEAYSTGHTTGCGAEDDCDDSEDRRTSDVLLDMVPVDKEKTLSMQPVVLPYSPPGQSSADIPLAGTHRRPPLAIQRKPLGSSPAMPLASSHGLAIEHLAESTSGHTRSSSSPAMNMLPTSVQTSLATAQVRSNSSSPPKSNLRMRLMPLRRPKLGVDDRGVTIPCMFPTTAMLNADNIDDDVNEHWPTSNPCKTDKLHATGTIVRKRRVENLELKKWKTLEAVPLPFGATRDASPPYPRNNNSGIPVLTSDEGMDEVSLEGPELLYSPSLSQERRPAVRFELHPRVRDATAEAQRLGMELLKQRGWFYWGVKVGLLCWAGVVLWALLDALREGLGRVLWPVMWAWGVVVWIVGG